MGSSQPAAATSGRLLVVSGVRSGIGRSLALGAAARDLLVVGCATSPVERLREDAALGALLDSERLVYVQADVAERAQVDALADRVRALEGERPWQQLWVVANAGISRVGDPGDANDFQRLERMRRVNVDGMRHLGEALRGELARAARGCFVTMSSIVAAEGRAIGGDIYYMATKIDAQYYAAGVIPHREDFRGVESFAVAPGIVPTPMIEGESLLPLVLRTTIHAAAGDAGLAEGLARAMSPSPPRGAQDIVDLGAGQVLRGLIHEVAGGDEAWLQRVDAALAEDPELARRGLTTFVRRARKDAALSARIVDILYELDVAVSPDLVAERILDQLASGQLPRQRLLKVYSRAGTNPVLALLRAM